MNEDYLWDGSGPADPMIARLEQALRPLRGSPPAAGRWPREAAVSGAVPTATAGREGRRRRSPWLVAGAFGVAFAAAAAVLILPSTAVGPGHTAIAGRGGSRIERGAGATSAGGVAGFGGAGGYGGS
jgi:hypothetical protein